MVHLPTRISKTLPMPRNDTIQKLLSRAHGGEDAAVVPGMGAIEDLPKSHPPAGVSETLSFLANRVQSSSSDSFVEWVFLVGGPGNGKSFELVKLLAHLGKKIPEVHTRGLAPRGFDVPVEAGTLQVVNDASIPSEEIDTRSNVGSLSFDLREALTKRPIPHLLVNINRGIIVEEAASLPEGQEWSTVRDILRWLHSETPGVDSHELTEVNVGAGRDFFRHAHFQSEKYKVRLYAVSLDKLSLLERVPGEGGEAVSGLGTDRVSTAEYRVMGMADASRTDSPAGRLLKSMVEESRFEDVACGECPAAEVCPFLSNVRTLRGKDGLLGVLKLLRGAEVASGRLFTYRDLWAIVSSVLVGPRRSSWDVVRGRAPAAVHPCEWVQEQAAKIETASAKGSAARYVLALARHRLHQGLFSEEPPRFLPSSAEDVLGEATTPALRSVALVDPILDVTPDWAEDVSRAMEGTVFGRPPGQALRGDSSAFDRVCQPLDNHLDELGLSWRTPSGNDLSPDERREIIAWSARCLYRLYALATGNFAHQTAITEWIELRRKAGRSSAEIDTTDLGKALRELLLPPTRIGDRREWAFLPLFHARTEPVVRPRDEYSWCTVVERNKVASKIEASGDSVWLVLTDAREEEKPITRVQVDLATCREGLASARGGGFTECGAYAAPRLERARASFIADGRTPKLAVLVQSSWDALSFNKPQ